MQPYRLISDPEDDQEGEFNPISNIELVSSHQFNNSKNNSNNNNHQNNNNKNTSSKMCKAPVTIPDENNNNVRLVWRRMRYLTFVAAIGGFLFGYDTGVVSGAMLPMKRAFDLTPQQQEVVVSSTVLAAFCSSLFLGAPLNDRYGRRYSILLSALVFGIGSLILFVANGYTMLVIGRIVLGLGIGVASLTTPIYIAEVAVPEMRGRLVTVNTLLITFGQFFAGMVDGFFDSRMPESGWRYMLGLAAVPSLVMFVGFLELPESPRWLANKGRFDEARIVLEQYRATKEEAEEELKEIANSSKTTTTTTTTTTQIANDGEYNERSSLASDDSSSSHNHYGSHGSSTQQQQQQKSQTSSSNLWIAMLSDPPTRRALLLGCGLMAVQQCSGINTVMYYAASIYQMAGYDELTAVWLSGFTALAQVVGIATSILLVDRVGRRTLVLSSLGFVTLSLMGLATSFYYSRISSGLVTFEGDYDDDDTMDVWYRCIEPGGMIWDGFINYCYDCAKTEGCGYCAVEKDGVLHSICEPGSRHAPFDRSVICKVWEYDTCQASSAAANNGRPNPYGIWSVLFMVLYLLAFGIGMGGMPWTINSEIYKLEYRSMAVSLSTATNWIGNLVVSATFLTLSSPQVLTAYGAFALYGGVAFLGWAWLVWALPETKGLSLEEIEGLFQRPWDRYETADHVPLETRDLDEEELNESPRYG